MVGHRQALCVFVALLVVLVNGYVQEDDGEKRKRTIETARECSIL